MTIYSESYASEILAAISELIGGVLIDFSFEIQDAGNFLLITTSPPKKLMPSEFDELEKQVRKYLDERIPKRNGNYAWMLTILEKGVVVGTVLPDMA